MRTIERAVAGIVRPVYRRFVERPLWWFLAKVKEFFFAETLERLRNLEIKLDTRMEGLTRIEHELRQMDRSNAAQWDAIEQLLLAVFRQPALRTTIEQTAASLQHTPVVSADDCSPVNGSNNIR